MKTNLTNAALGAFVGAAVTLCIAAATDKGPTIWQYRIITPPPSQLNNVGLVWALDSAARDGWEAIGVGATAGEPWVLTRKARD